MAKYIFIQLVKNSWDKKLYQRAWRVKETIILPTPYSFSFWIAAASGIFCVKTNQNVFTMSYSDNLSPYHLVIHFSWYILIRYSRSFMIVYFCAWINYPRSWNLLVSGIMLHALRSQNWSKTSFINTMSCMTPCDLIRIFWFHENLVYI